MRPRHTQPARHFYRHAVEERNQRRGEQSLAWFLKEQLEEMSSMADVLTTVGRAIASNILPAEDYLAPTAIGDQGKSADTPPAAGRAL